MRTSVSRKVFNIFNYFAMLLLCASVILPFMHILSISLSDKYAIIGMEVTFWPKGMVTQAYKDIVTDIIFLRAFINTIFITATITISSLIILVMAAYAFSKDFYAKKIFNYYFILTMYFSGGLIPFYILMTNVYRLQNTYFALILPSLVSVFYMIVIRTQIQTIPASLIEAAKIDGAKEAQVLFKVVVPSITPTIAAMAMFITLGSWNSWFNVMLFANSEKLWTLQYYLRAVVISKTATSRNTEAAQRLMELGITEVLPDNYQMAAIILIALPVVCIYPFVQKHFVKGILTGAVKE